MPQKTSRQTVGQWLVWWCVLAGLWLLLVAKATPDNLVAAAITAALAASAALVLTRLGLFPGNVPPGWLRPLARVPRQVLRDTGIVAAALWRHLIQRGAVQGKMREVSFDPGGDDFASSARRALVVFAVSLSPNTVAVSIDRTRQQLRVHELVPRPDTAPGSGDRKWPI